MNSLKWNMMANILGRGWGMLLNVIFIPFYIQFLGVEAYGLIGFYGVLMAVSGLLDLGLGATLNRELARLSAREDTAREQRDLVRTLEVVYWSISLLIALVIWYGASLIADHWLNASSLPSDVVLQAIQLMGLVVALQFPFGFYQGGLMGLQHQVQVNIVLVIIGTLRFGGAVLVLWLVSPTIQAFFAWQVVTSIIGAGVFCFGLWNRLPGAPQPPAFKPEMLWALKSFALSISGNAVVGVMITQVDKVVLSKMVSLKVFGFYALANTLASFVGVLVTPINSALLPRFAQLWERQNMEELSDLYHTACQLMTVVVMPMGMLLAFFSHEILQIWTQNPELAENAYVITALLVLATSMNSLNTVPGHLQIAAGWPQLMMVTNLGCMILSVPFMIFMTKSYGAIGAASVWVGINVFFLLVYIPLMHKRLLKGQMGEWYLSDVLLPWLGVVSVVGMARWVFPGGLSWWVTVLALGLFWVLATATGLSLAPRLRQKVWSQLRKYVAQKV